MASFITENFVPVKIHIKEQPGTFDRFGVQWTPTLLVLDSGGVERHRWEGYLPKDDFLAHLELGLAKIAFAHKRFADAEERFRRIVTKYPASAAAPEALYWAGVAKYKATDNPAALKATAEALRSRYQQDIWTTKASVWLS